MDSTAKFVMDSQIKALCARCTEFNHRCVFILRGKNVAEKVVALHHLLSLNVEHAKSVLWCHEKDAQWPKSIRKTLKLLKKKIKSGKMNLSEMQPFDIFLYADIVRFCSYQDTVSALGNTYSMCVLQDVECLTPNIMCRVIETVRGGGAVVLLLPDMPHIRHFATLDMLAHYRLTTHSHPKPCKLFNNRLLASLSWCSSCLVLDDNMRVCNDIVPFKSRSGSSGEHKVELSELQAAKEQLQQLQEQLAEAAKPLPQLVHLCKTHDQAKALVKMVDVLTENHPGDVVSVTAGRGRGKSAVLGLAVAAAIDLGLTNIFVSSPSPHNLVAFFQLLFTGFDALGYKEGSDYEILQSTNPDFAGAIVRVIVSRDSRHTVQYLLPSDHAKLELAQLLVVDEAAAIPLSQVQALLGRHITLMASTISGYEGTGRSLSLKLLKQLRQQSSQARQSASQVNTVSAVVHELHELTLSHSIRYSKGDPVEAWLNDLLCLDATEAVPPITGYPAPQNCQLYYVDKSVLLSGHKSSEVFLRGVQSLLVSSHYRNSPDDLQMLADAPAHHLFVLLAPFASQAAATAGIIKNIPPVLCVLQVCLEGGVPVSVARRIFAHGENPPGDIVPWNLCKSANSPDLAKYTGVRVVRAATHPDCQSMGYGTRAIRELQDYYNGHFINIAELHTLEQPMEQDEEQEEEGEKTGPVVLKPMTKPLLRRLSERMPETADYISVSYGVTPQLYKFWAKLHFLPLIVGLTVNQMTGEHNCIMVYPLSPHNTEDSTPNASPPLPDWLLDLCKSFVWTFVDLLNHHLKDLHPTLAHDMIISHKPHTKEKRAWKWRNYEDCMRPDGFPRLEKYVKNNVHHHMVTDVVQAVARMYYRQQLPGVELSKLQASLLVGTGLQKLSIVDAGARIDLTPQSAMGNYIRMMRRAYNFLARIQEEHYMKRVASVVPDLLTPVTLSVDEDLSRLARETEQERPDLHFHTKKRRDVESYNQPKPQQKKKKLSY